MQRTECEPAPVNRASVRGDGRVRTAAGPLPVVGGADQKAALAAPLAAASCALRDALFLLFSSGQVPSIPIGCVTDLFLPLYFFFFPSSGQKA